jgi:hypothetical protein
METDGFPDGGDGDADGEGGGFGGRLAPTAAVLTMTSNIARIAAMLMLQPRERTDVPTVQPPSTHARCDPLEVVRAR